ncbi:MAG TPA: sigma factor [Verrucomicrobiae bacterium]|nr:sigma factor [Verrucomicrobiae bacterium]
MTLASANHEFPRTRWTAVLRVRDGVVDPLGEKALAELCEMYWSPLFAFARRCGHGAEDAEDLTQGFFTRLLARDLFAKADPSRGRLRSFLLGAFKNYMSEEHRQAGRQKRGGNQVIVSIDELGWEVAADEGGEHDPAVDAESLFDRVWFDTLLEHALAALEQEYARRGKGELFRRLQDFLAWNRKDGKLEEAARDLEMSPGALRVAILRMRHRFRELIERQIMETVQSPAEAAEEMQHLRRVLGA